MRVVICGAGTAGCVAAARLSEEPGLEVSLLEAGPHYRPGAWPAGLTHSHRIIKETHDWGYEARAGASPRMVHVPRGRVVGGSSVTNGAIALRGLPEHYDAWSEWVDGYGWESWLPWFRAIEADRDFGEDAHHGADGPIAISRYRRPFGELQERFYEAALSVGHAPLADHNAPGALGLGPVPLNMIEGVRQTPADHYLAPALARPNLRLHAGVVVDRVELAGDRVRAVHALDAQGRPLRLPADAVVMALGTYASPAALLRSGIGPEAELARHGLRVAHARAGVGRGMQDHPKVSYRFDLHLPVPPWPGPWYEALLTGAHEVAEERRVYQVLPYSGQLLAGHAVTDLNVQVADARSRRGAVRLQSLDPRAQPAIEMGWFLEPSDRAAAVAAGERLLELAGAPALATTLTPWPNIADPDQILRTVETFHHPVGSVRMGRPEDPKAVVGADGAVLGLSGLYVIDAAVIPRVPSANTHLCVIALAERLSAGLRAALARPGAELRP